jgi:hypothetical protein
VRFRQEKAASKLNGSELSFTIVIFLEANMKYVSGEPPAPSSAFTRGLKFMSNLASLVSLLFYTSLAMAASGPPTVTTLGAGTVWPSGGVGVLNATVTANGSPVSEGIVTFYEGAVPIGQATLQANGTATLSTPMPPGEFTLTARFNGSNAGAPSTSSPVTLGHLGMDSTALASSGLPGQSILTATVTGDQTVPPTGNVIFTDQTTGATLGSVPLVPGPVTSNLPYGLFPYGTVFGNFQGRGLVDYATLVPDPNNVSVRDLAVSLSNGDGTFNTFTSEVLPQGRFLLASGDFNGDGFTDLVLLGYDTSSFISILLCDGTGHFTQGGTVSNVQGLSDVITVGDFNADGALDLLMTTGPESQLTFIPGDGHGNLGTPQVTSLPINEPFLPADFNRDGSLDLLMTPEESGGASGPETVYLGQGNGTGYTPEPQSVFGSYGTPASVPSPLIGDFNGDGIPDLAVFNGTSSVTVLLGDGTGAFRAASGAATEIGSHSIVSGYPMDINGDGVLDLVLFVTDSSTGGQTTNGVLELIGDGTGKFSVSPETLESGAPSTGPYNGVPVPFTFPSLGYPGIVSSPPAATATATLTGVSIPGTLPHNVIATYQGNDLLPPSTSNTVAVQGGSSATPPPVGFGQGFAAGGVRLNGSAKLVGSVIELTDGQTDEAGSFFYPTTVDVRGFVTDFDFQMMNAQADGFTFTIQGVNPYALGGTGGALGYAGIPTSAAVKFDIFNNAGEGNNSTGLYTNGATPTVPSISLVPAPPSTQPALDLSSGNVMHAHILYTNYNQLKVTISDPTTGASLEQDYTIDLASTVGQSAYVGFTGGTGALTATQSILDWTYSPLPNYEILQAGPPPTELADMSAAGMVFNGGAAIVPNNPELRLIESGVADEARSAYFSTPVNVQKFTTDFMFQATNAIGDGFTFVLQNAGPSAVGPSGGGLGYGPDTPYGGVGGGIPQSVAVKFDFYSNVGEGTDSTGIYLNGASPTLPCIDLSSTGIVLTSSDIFDAHMTYDGATLAVTLTDTNTGATATQDYPVDIPTAVGGTTALAGFTGGTGALSATENILDWTYAPTN